MIKDAKEKGAKMLVGDGTRQGAVVQPHLVADVKTDMWIWNRETFGPVTTVIEFDTIEEAIELANASDYSLTSALWTQNVNIAFDVGGQIRASLCCRIQLENMGPHAFRLRKHERAHRSSQRNC
ncbi:hypothetical protein CERSUDRAFT_116216 [Gelatoporia subvermispora B]|uniref:Aldehyde dehydrogenase domain-containing protein n=1 Tax=Ceriporiopsis subvermispora (strain B) TaxID=914234 RepID=M2RAM4_CERS8|nr:hypothetical protein CERSUDRAFT_116216 [Gelatoporia subvermispora B]